MYYWNLDMIQRKKVADADYRTLYETIKQLNNERNIYNAHIGVNDMKMIIESAQGLNFEIESHVSKTNKNDMVRFPLT